MTEFDKFWNECQVNISKKEAENIWHNAQRALLRTIQNPPFIPKIGNKIKILSLCHPKLLGEVREITNIHEYTIKVFYITSKDFKDEFSTVGILSEVEKV